MAQLFDKLFYQIIVIEDMSTALPFSEHELVHAVQTKNAKVFSGLYDMYAGAIFGTIKKIIGCSLDAEDVLQNVFVKIWANGHLYVSEKGKLYTWMLRIAHNESIDYLRSKDGKKEMATSSLVEKHYDYAVTDSAGDNLDVKQSMALMPQRERAIVYLNHAGYSSREIGVLLGIPEGTVKTKIRATYRKLRCVLA